jgi:histidyl-tRNA synthetase
MLQETECLKIADEVLSALAVGEFEIRVKYELDSIGHLMT